MSAGFQQGSFLDFAVNTEITSFAQPNTNTSTTDFGMFRVTLGAPMSIGGATVYPLSVTGTTTVGTVNFLPRWTHIGISGGSVVGSTDGATLKTIYNGSTASGAAAGFFVAFGASETVNATSATFTGQYNTLAAVRSGHSTSSGGCESILGQTLCSDITTTFSETEYYKDGVGPVAYTLNITYSSSSGGFTTATTIKRTLEIAGTSLTAVDGALIKAPPWQEVAPMATARKNPAASAFGGELYVFGGLNAANTALGSVEIYNPGTNQWRAGTAAPVTLGFHKAKTIGTKTYLIASNAAVRIFDHVGNSWTAGLVSTFNDPSFDIDTWFNTGTGENFIVVVSSNIAGPIEVRGYKVALNQWVPGVSFMFTDHRWHAISVIGDNFYLAGGFRNSQTPKIFSGTYRYVLPTDVWTTSGLGTLQTPRQQARAVNLAGAMVLLGGTSSAAGTGALRDVESYNVAGAAWTKLPPMLRARINHAAVVLGGKIYAIGGDAGDGTPTARVEAYTP